MAKLTVLIPCFNSEKVVRPTLKSVQWADEIVACDSFSTDRTLDLMREAGARIIQNKYINSASQKNWAIPQCSHEWILIVDTDEVLEPALIEEIQNIILKDDLKFQAYKIPRKNFVYGAWMKHGGLYPDYQIRLFRKGNARYESREVHASMIVKGEIGRVKGHFLHEGFKDIREWFLKTERYVTYERDEFIKKGRKFSFFKALFYPPIIFLRNYFLRRGFLQGFPGFLIASLDSVYYFMIYSKLYEYEKIEKAARSLKEK